MIFDIVPILPLRFEKVHYFTVRFDGLVRTEFRDFIARMSGEEGSKTELAEINRYIEQIGRTHGARPEHFRDEGAADGLPPAYHQFVESDGAGNFGLRLYCIRLTTSVVLLLNGGRKTAQKVKDCINCYPHFKIAVRIAKCIDKAIADGYVEISEDAKEIYVEEDFQLSI